MLRAFAVAPPPNTRITLLSPFPDLLYSGMVPGLVAGLYAPRDCAIALEPLAARAAAVFMLTCATAVDAAAQCVTGTDVGGIESVLRYDLLSIDVGGVIDPDPIAGAKEHALLVRPIERFVAALRARVDEACAGPRDVVVIGGGAGGFEIALALRARLGASARLHLVTGGPPLLAAHSIGVRRRALRALRRRGVSVHEAACVAVDERHVELGTGARIDSELAIVATGSAAPRWLRNSGLALDANGFVATGPALQSLSSPRVFAAGDVATRADAARPRSGVYAVRAGPPLAHNLRCALEDRPLAPYRPQTHALNLLSCGDGHAIASWGAWSFEGRAVWWLKDRIDRRFVALNRAA